MHCTGLSTLCPWHHYSATVVLLVLCITWSRCNVNCCVPCQDVDWEFAEEAADDDLEQGASEEERMDDDPGYRKELGAMCNGCSWEALMIVQVLVWVITHEGLWSCLATCG